MLHIFNPITYSQTKKIHFSYHFNITWVSKMDIEAVSTHKHNFIIQENQSSPFSPSILVFMFALWYSYWSCVDQIQPSMAQYKNSICEGIALEWWIQ